MTIVEALKNLYVAMGGEASNVENLTLNPDMVNAIAELVASGGGDTLAVYYNGDTLSATWREVCNALQAGKKVVLINADDDYGQQSIFLAATVVEGMYMAYVMGLNLTSKELRIYTYNSGFNPDLPLIGD